MARETGIYRRKDSRFWWIDVVLTNGRRVCQSAKTEDRKAAQALVAKFKLDAFRAQHLGIKPRRSWQEAVVRYLIVKSNLRSIEDVRRICRKLDPYFGALMLDEITGDRIWAVVQSELKKGNNGGSLREVCDGASCGCGIANRERQGRKRHTALYVFPTPERAKG